MAAPKGGKARAKGEAKPKREVDWERIQDDFRANQLSLREIAAQHGIVASMISRRAKRENWPRDLEAKVRRETRERLLRDEQQAEQQSEQHQQRARDTVERCVTRNVELVNSHRKDLQQLHALQRIMAERLSQVLDGIPPEGPCLGERESPSDLLEKLSRVTARLIPLARQAHNLDDDGKLSAAEGGIQVGVTVMTPSKFEEIARRVSSEF